jgi:two-component system, OmpR family, KDP operon response regulator KdpE
VNDTVGAPKSIALVIEDEAPIRKFLRTGLESQGFQTVEAATGQEGVAHAAMRAPDVVLLDIGLPDIDGFEVVRRIREWSTTPVIVLSARGLEQDKIRALDAGADDYVTKPFSMGELLARIRVALRRQARIRTQSEESAIEVGTLRVDLGKREVTVSGHLVRLTPIEYRLLALLAKHAGKVLTHDVLLREIWGPEFTSQRHYLRVHMAQLRHKIEANPARPRLLLTDPGVGYRLRFE